MKEQNTGGSHAKSPSSYNILPEWQESLPSWRERTQRAQIIPVRKGKGSLEIHRKWIEEFPRRSK